MGGERRSVQRLLPAGSAPAEASTALRDPRGARIESGPGPLGPRGVGQILDAGLDVLVRRFAAIVGIAALCWYPVELASELLLRHAGQDPILFAVFLVGITFPVQVLTVSFVCGLVGAELTGRGLSVVESVRMPASRLVGVGTISLLTLFASTLGVCLCCAPAVACFWLFSVAPAVYVLEAGRVAAAVRGGGAPPGWTVEVLRAMGRSVSLVLGWSGFGRWLGWSVVGAIMVLPLSLLSSSLEDPHLREVLQGRLSIRGSAYELLITALSAVFVGAANAYVAVNMTVFYVDSRVRKEAFDLELELGRLAGGRA